MKGPLYLEFLQGHSGIRVVRTNANTPEVALRLFKDALTKVWNKNWTYDIECNLTVVDSFMQIWSRLMGYPANVCEQRTLAAGAIEVKEEQEPLVRVVELPEEWR